MAGDPQGEEHGWMYPSAATHQAISLIPPILMKASDNISCILVRFQSPSQLQTLFLYLAAFPVITQEIHLDPH